MVDKIGTETHVSGSRLNTGCIDDLADARGKQSVCFVPFVLFQYADGHAALAQASH
jgi:hypothetical protein